jgi:hypothetical protein
LLPTLEPLFSSFSFLIRLEYFAEAEMFHLSREKIASAFGITSVGIRMALGRLKE